jgi:hypothetical protein
MRPTRMQSLLGLPRLVTRLRLCIKNRESRENTDVRHITTTTTAAIEREGQIDDRTLQIDLKTARLPLVALASPQE